MGGDGPQHNIPIGIIVAFHTLSINDPIPDGWRECDGNNGTPDLRGRFILGDESPRTTDTTEVKYVLDDVGGVEKHTLTDAEQNTPHTHNQNVKLRLSCKDNGGQLNAINDQGNPHLNTTAKNTTFRNPNALNTNYYHTTIKSTNYWTRRNRCLTNEIQIRTRSCGWMCTKRVCQKKVEIKTKCSGNNCPPCSGDNCPRCSGDNCPPCIPGAPVANGGCPGRDCSGIDIATAPKKYNTTPRISAAAVAHENMPPFYVLRYIMKV